MGELRRLELMMHTGAACACGRRIEDCPFWNRVASQAGLSLRRVRTLPARSLWSRRFGQLIGWSALKSGMEATASKLLNKHQGAARDCLDIYEAAARVTGARIVVDSSKTPAQFLHLFLENKDIVRPIFLVRYGRAVVWSKMRRTGISAARASRQWRNVCNMVFALQRVAPASSRNFVKYEELCRKPVEVIGSVLDAYCLPRQIRTARAFIH